MALFWLSCLRVTGWRRFHDDFGAWCVVVVRRIRRPSLFHVPEGWFLVSVCVSLVSRWQDDPERSLRRCEFLAPEVDGAAFDAQSDLEDVLREVRAFNASVTRIGDTVLSEEMHRVQRTAIEGGFAACFEPGASESLDNLAAAVEGSAHIDVRRVRSQSSLDGDSVPNDAELTTDHLARLHRRLIFAMAAYQKASWHWEMLIRDSLALEDQLAGGVRRMRDLPILFNSIAPLYLPSFLRSCFRSPLHRLVGTPHTPQAQPSGSFSWRAGSGCGVPSCAAPPAALWLS